MYSPSVSSIVPKGYNTKAAPIAAFKFSDSVGTRTQDPPDKNRDALP